MKFSSDLVIYDLEGSCKTFGKNEIHKSTLAGWGLYYDLPLLRKEFTEFGLDYNQYFVGGGFDIRALGVYWLAKKNISTSGISLERVLQKMNIKEDFKFHRALDDAKATALILQQILNEK